METLKTQSAYSRALKTLAICTAISTVGLTACHNDHDSVPTTTNTNGMVTLSGTAATGAALKNASVTASCKNNSGFSTPVSTNDKGQWTGQVLATNLPCALQAKTADLALHSYATAAGNVNITPLTDLSIAMISRKNPADWFKQYQVLLESQLKAATDEIAKQLASKNYVLPEEFNLFNSTFAIGDAFDKMLDALMAAITSSSLKNYNALLNQVVATGSTASIPAAMPTPPNNTRSCASRKLPVTTLNSITDYSGVYKNKGTTVFNLDTATAQIIASGNTAMVTEVCGPNVLNNGTNHVLVTDKGYVTLFKDNNGKYSAETSDFGGFYGEKAAANSTPCESNGADDKLGFKNAPQDFCSFSKASSVAISSPDIYTFFNADKTQNIKITVENKAVKSVQLEDNTYAWACGVGSYAACSGITFDQRNASFVQFPFNNVVLTPVYGTQQPITIKNGLLIHSNSTTTPPVTGSCVGNTSPWGCISITGQVPLNPIQHFVHKPLNNKAPVATIDLNPTEGIDIAKGGYYAIAGAKYSHVIDTTHFSALSVYSYHHEYNGKPFDSSLVIFSIHETTSSTSEKYVQYTCGAKPSAQANNLCNGLTIDANARTATFNNVNINFEASDNLGQLNVAKNLILNGTMKF